MHLAAIMFSAAAAPQAVSSFWCRKEFLSKDKDVVGNMHTDHTWCSSTYSYVYDKSFTTPRTTNLRSASNRAYPGTRFSCVRQVLIGGLLIAYQVPLSRENG